MFEQLLDPDPPELGSAMRRRVIADGQRRRLRTRLAAGSAVLVSCVAIGGLATYLRSQSEELERIRVIGLTPADDPTVSSPTNTTPSNTVPNSGAVGEDQTVPPIAVPLNILVAGVDHRPEGSAVTGSRADTIAVVRIDPQLERVSVLSLPRDLWVSTGGGTSGRINSLSQDGSLVAVVSELLDIELNHYVEVDFDGFESLIDIAGGVTVPFDQAVRDSNTGFEAGVGCNDLSGADALAYVRSRKLETLDPATNQWIRDPSSDIGRITRQQDLIQRIYTAVLAQSYNTTDKVRLLSDVVDDLTVDNGLDLDGVQAIFNAATNIGPNNFRSYDISSAITPVTVQGNAVLMPDFAGIAIVVDGFLDSDDNSDIDNPETAADSTFSDAVAPSATTC